MRRLSWPAVYVLTLVLAAGVLGDHAGANGGPPPTQAAAQAKAPVKPAAAAKPAPAPAVPEAPPVDLSAPLPGALSPRNANYSIDVTLDAPTHTLSGRSVLTWRNISNVSTVELRFHLYYNAWKNSRSTWMREAALRGGRNRVPGREDWGWIDVNAVRLLPGNAPPIDLTARKRYISPDDGNPDDQTVMVVPLPEAVDPGDTVNIELSWSSKIPRTFARTGVIGNYYFIAQWFPKIGVLEDSGWNCHQFHAGTGVLRGLRRVRTSGSPSPRAGCSARAGASAPARRCQQHHDLHVPRAGRP